MSTHKYIDRICAAAVALCLVLTLLFLNGEALGLQPASRVMGYEVKLFDTSKVHTIEIIMDDWDGFLDTCENEEYAACSVVIDNEAYKNVGIRAKGNTSLSTVAQLGSDRYSFKLEFDQYDSGKTYHGLDKLCLNNLIQDNTMMKDYLTYQLMGEFGVAAPLCSYVYITVNGEDWGLYLAVEGVEDSFLQRNYGKNHGELYKPDSLSFGGGRGNGRDFNMDDFMNQDSEGQDGGTQPQGQRGGMPEGFTSPPGDNGQFPGGDRNPPEDFAPASGDNGQFPGGNGNPPENFTPASGDNGQFPGGDGNPPEGFTPDSGDNGQFPGGGGNPPEDFTPPSFENQGNNGGQPEDFQPGGQPGGGGPGDFGPGGMGSDDVKLQYSDDDPDSYSSIFDSAKTDITEADQARLIQALKALGEGDVESALDVEQVLRYLVVHNYVVNGDSYTGSMVHNYYLYEEDGRLAMLPWDYNLAFGTFQGNDAAGAVNNPIDSPLSVTGDGSRPMADWVFSSEEYTALYHQYFTEFLNQTDPGAIIEETYTLIAPYVEQDPTKFCTDDEFEAGVAALKTFCQLRTESVTGQLSGSIPSTSAGQSTDSAALVDASGLTLSDMGTMGGGGPGGGPGGGMTGGDQAPPRKEQP